MELKDIELQCVQDSAQWFGEAIAFDVGHMALAMAGEVGEFCNIVKKIGRRSLDPQDSQVKFDMAMELTDIFIYLCNLGGILQVNLEEAYKIKRQQNVERFDNGKAILPQFKENGDGR